MKVKCKYCDQMIADTNQTCPYCGAPNEQYVRVAEGVPKTIKELQNWAMVHNAPLEEMRTFIGVDYREPKAFGIYKDSDGNFVVYKNKADGTRAVRYKGNDEAYAVNELYMKMKERIAQQKATRVQYNQPRRYSRGRGAIVGVTVFYSIFIIIFTSVFLMASAMSILSNLHFSTGHRNGYYTYEDKHYYHQYDDYYVWNDYIDTWDKCYSWEVPDALVDSPNTYYDSRYYDAEWDIDSFSESEWYDDSLDSKQSWSADWDSDSSSSWSSDSDSSYDWDSGSDWDSGYDDWDSDW